VQIICPPIFDPSDELGGTMAAFLGQDELCKGHHFDRAVVVLRVRWYPRFKLSYRDLVEMMAGFCQHSRH
jgi:hypothetical protein